MTPLSTDDLDALLHNDDPQAVNGPNDVRARLWAIEKLETEIDETKTLLDDAVTFYKRRIETREQQIERLKTQIEAYLRATGQSSLPTEKGTVMLQERTKKQWPGKDALLDWCVERDLMKKPAPKRVSKREIKRYMDETGERPPGYEEEPYEVFMIRSAPSPSTDADASSTTDEVPY